MYIIYDMRIVIVGVGKAGKTIVKALTDENHDVVIIDTQAKVLEPMVNQFDVKGLIGSGCERSVLIEAEADQADVVIACTSSDEKNILCCVLAKKLGAKYTIARVREPEYSKEMSGLKNELGLDYVINPEYRTANEIAHILKYPSAISVENFAGGKVNMVEFLIEKDNALIGRSLMAFAKDFRSKVLISMVKRGEEVIVPRGDFVIKEGDVIHIIGTEQDIFGFCKKLSIFKPSAKSVFIIGGGKTAYYLAAKLISSGISVKILERDEARCAMISDALPKANVFCGDGTDHELLNEEGICDSDACITLTGIDEENVIISIYALQQGVKKVITKVDRDSVLQMVGTLGLGTVVSPMSVIANHILRFVRSHQDESDNGITTLYKLYDKAEALEFTVTEDFEGLNTPLKELEIDRDVLLGGIVRNGEFIIPGGDATIRAKDKVLVITKARKIQMLADILRS